jgi:hypothetical protein
MEKCFTQQTKPKQGLETMAGLLLIFAGAFKKLHPVMHRSSKLP